MKKNKIIRKKEKAAGEKNRWIVIVIVDMDDKLVRKMTRKPYATENIKQVQLTLTLTMPMPIMETRGDRRTLLLAD